MWTPDMGDGAEPEQGKPLPPNRFYSEQFNDFRQRQENRARLASWMNGREPVEVWENLGLPQHSMTGKDDVIILYTRFPTTNHDVFCMASWVELGRLVVWCFGCKRSDCGAARWAEQRYRKEWKFRRSLFDVKDDLPF